MALLLLFVLQKYSVVVKQECSEDIHKVCRLCIIWIA
jgi:hypothetical protein